MALDELHARRLATIGKVFDAALDRMELILGSAEEGSDRTESTRITTEQAQAARERMATIRSRLQKALQNFSIQLQRPEPKQMLAAELSTLWVILENARPERMKGYGREFAPQDRAEWENLLRTLMNEIDQIRAVLLKGKVRA
jgi:hypothetical protein